MELDGRQTHAANPTNETEFFWVSTKKWHSLKFPLVTTSVRYVLPSLIIRNEIKRRQSSSQRIFYKKVKFLEFLRVYLIINLHYMRSLLSFFNFHRFRNARYHLFLFLLPSEETKLKDSLTFAFLLFGKLLFFMKKLTFRYLESGVKQTLLLRLWL